MLYVNGKAIINPNSVKKGNKNVIAIYKGNKLIYPLQFTTEIEFEVTITSETANTDIPLISLYNETGEGYYTITTDNRSSIHPIPIISDSPIENYDGNIIYVHEGAPITYRWTQLGTYNVKVLATEDITGTRFTSLRNVNEDRIAYDVNDNPHITRLIKYKSTSITNLFYTFAGLVNCVPHSDFVLETPNVESEYASFYKFGSGVWRNSSNASLTSWSFNRNLLNSCTKLTSLNGTFYLCKLKRIPVHFFDKLTNVTVAYDVFKRSSLGRFSYVNYSLQDFLEENVNGTSYIPMSLFHYMPNLTIIEGCFNAIEATNRQGFGITTGQSTNDLGYGNWNNVGLYIKADLFFNGKAVGNERGSIQYMDYLFGKINQAAFEKDLFRYIKHSVIDMEGAFFHTHWVIGDTLSQSMLFGWNNSPVANNWLQNTTYRVDVLLGNTPFLALRKINGAFAVAPSEYNRGFYSNHDVWGMYFGAGEIRTNGLTNEILNNIRATIPVAINNTQPNIQSPTTNVASNGGSGGLYNLKVENDAFGTLSSENSNVTRVETVWY